MTEFCAQCGSAVETTDRFCRKCGNTITSRDDDIAADTSRSNVRRRFMQSIAIGLGLSATAAAGLGYVAWQRSGDVSSEATDNALAPAPVELSGTWEGTYSYAVAGSPPVSFTFAASFDSSRISGTIMEPHALGSATPPTQVATAIGRFEGTSIHFSKRYSSGSPVEYEGTLNPTNKTIEGRWQGENLRGTFRMAYRTPDQRVVAAVAPQPKIPEAPRVQQGQAVFEQRLKRDVAPSRAVVVSFNKTDGQTMEVYGVRGYRMFYSARVRFPNGHHPECVSRGGNDFRGFDCGFRFSGANMGRTKPKAVGAIETFNGVLTFERRERGWVAVG